MTHAKRQVVDYWNQVWSQGDPDAPQRFYAEGATENGVPVQASAFAAGVQSWREKEAEGRVLSRVTYRGTHRATWAGIPATGRTFAVPGLDLWRIEEGRIVEHWHATDHLEVVFALGGTIGPSLEQ